MLFHSFDIIRILAAFQFLLVSICLFTHTKGKQISNKLLGLFLLSKSFSLINSLLFRFKTYLADDYPYIYCIAGTLVFLYGPSLFYYTKSLIYRNFGLKKRDLLHLTPFFAYCIFQIFNFHIHSADFKRQLLARQYIYNYYEALVIIGFLYLQVFAYTLGSLVVLQRYRSQLKNVFSLINRVNLSWLNILLYGFIMIWMIEFVNFIKLMATGTPVLYLDMISLVCVFVFANIIVYKGLKQPEIFIGIEEKPKYEKSTLTVLDSKNYLARVQHYMELEKPYLAPTLTLTELADKVAIPPRHLSQVINESLHQNFFDFVNSYRIEAAKHHLSNHFNNKKTILEILYEVGFNSKSTFNNVFKKHTGVTPKEFKKFC